MNATGYNEKNSLRPQLVIFGMAAALALSACGESGTDSSQQSQQTTADSTATEMQVPEETVTETPATPEPEMPAATTEEPVVSEPGPEAAMADEPATATDESQEVAVAESEEAPAADGRQVYYTYCAVCHKTGLNAAPKIGNKALWAKRVAQGREVVYKNAIEGLRGMPPRGGIASLSDEEVKAATDFMVKASGGWNDS